MQSTNEISLEPSKAHKDVSGKEEKADGTTDIAKNPTSPKETTSTASKESDQSLKASLYNASQAGEANDAKSEMQINNAQKADKDVSKAPSASTPVDFNGLLERDFNDFEVIYPNVSKSTLSCDENLRIFAEGKEQKSLCVIYAQYLKMQSSIKNEAIRQERSRISNAASSVGTLSSSGSDNEEFFTKEQVLKMSPEQIKRHYTRIRESQALW